MKAKPKVLTGFGSKLSQSYRPWLFLFPFPLSRNDTSEVIDCMMDALTNQQPKADYIPDITSRVLACMFEILPIHWVDSMVLFRKQTGNRV